MSLTRSPLHPIIGAVADVRASLKTVADTSPTFMSTDDKAVALAELVRASAQLDELRLRLLGDAGDLAGSTAARDAAGWLAQHTRTRYTDARADLALACALDRDRPRLAAAMREGEATLAQAHVIRRSIDALPMSVDGDTVARAEEHLVAQARAFGPRELGRIGRRILDVVAPEIAEAAEAARLADLEANAEQQTRLTSDASGTAPPASPAASPTRPPHASRPSWSRTPTRASLLVEEIRSPACPARGVWARRSSSSSRRSTRPDCRSTGATRRRLSSRSRSLRSRKTSPPLASSTPVSCPETSSPVTASPLGRPGDWPAPRRSSPSSWAGTASRSTSGEPAASTARHNGRHC